jgi:ADP-heptose:LPS heptosyltransferase
MKSKDHILKILSLAVAGDSATAESEIHRLGPELETWELNYTLGAIAQAKGDQFEAEGRYRQAQADNSDYFDLYQNFTTLLQSQGRYFDSLPIAKRAFELNSSDKKAAVCYITALLDQGKVAIALEVIDHLPSLLRSDTQIQLARCASLRQAGRYSEALDLIRQLVKERPSDPVALRMHADTVGEKDSSSALAIYELAITCAEKSSVQVVNAIKWNMSLHLLRVRDFSRGWDYYEKGLTREVGTLGRKLPPNLTGLKLLDLESAKAVGDSWILIIVEQGIGDQIFFLSAFSEVLARLPKVLFMCEPRMKSIIARSYPQLQLIDPGILEYIGQSEMPLAGYLPLGSTIGPFRQSVNSFLKRRRPYLTVNRDMYGRFRSELKQKAMGRPIVGISWKGGFWENQQRNKTIPIQEWEAVFRREALIVNLQYGDIEEDCRWLKSKNLELVRFPNIDFKQNLDEWLALAAACDGIVSISTALVHFAGAAGQKVAMIMPELQGTYIWGVNEDQSIVYPNVHLFRPYLNESLSELVYRVSMVIK